MTATIDSTGHPLCFKVSQGLAVSPLLSGLDGQDIVQVDARQLHHHQKEAVVREGAGGGTWRLPSDEGAHLKGSDLAPFPLGFFNAGLHADLLQRIIQIAAERAINFSSLSIRLSNHYWFTGSFVLGTGSGHAARARILVSLDSGSPSEKVIALVHDALTRSPAIDLLRRPLVNTFALYINGRRRPVAQMPASGAKEAADPFLVYRSAPQPLEVNPARDLISKTDRREAGTAVQALPGTAGKVSINVLGDSMLATDRTQASIENWLEFPSATHFGFQADVNGGDSAPSGLALLSAGIAFCFMTQLSRYVEHMKLAINGIRLVQFSPYEVRQGQGRAHPVDTHLFLNGLAPEDVQERLIRIAAHTCYLHATAAAALSPLLDITHNGKKISPL
ncbi:MAG: OsmC family protein [Pseudomonadota bacterium]|nr:OsmC family protein [Pseudomonadota bacterium]